MWTWTFWKDAAERAISTAAQAAIALLSTLGVTVGLENVPWAAVASTAVLAGLLAVLKALVASRVGDPTSASLLPDVRPAG